MLPYIPPAGGELDAGTEEAIAGWRAALAAPDAWTKDRLPEVDGIVAILAAQFPGVPAGVLGRITASTAMALGAICGASRDTGTPLAPWDLAIILGFAGAKLATAGDEMTAMEARNG